MTLHQAHLAEAGLCIPGFDASYRDAVHSVEELDLNKQMTRTESGFSLVAAEPAELVCEEWSADMAIRYPRRSDTADVGMVAAGKSFSRQAAWME